MIRFISQAFRNYNATGAVVPSSRFLARAMVESIPCTEGQRILEVGCGTGAFTKEILKHLRAGDELYIVELNSDFCKAVESTIITSFRTSNPNITIEVHNSPIEESNLQGTFDVIICGLPFNNFPVQVVNRLFETMLGFLSDGGELVYFEYLGMRGFKRIFGTPTIRENTMERTKDINNRLQQHHGTQVTVWRNIPSCRVVRLRA